MPISIDIDNTAALAPLLERIQEFAPVRTGALRDSFAIDGNAITSDSDYWDEVEEREPYIAPAVADFRDMLPELITAHAAVGGNITLRI